MRTVQALDIALAELRYDESANTIYHFVWDTFCDWYLEFIKPLLSSQNTVRAEPVEAQSFSSVEKEERLRQAQAERPWEDETRDVAAWVLDQILVMLHPFMPFFTEELWNAMGERPYELILAKWPMPDARALDPAASAEIDWLIRLVSEIRAARTELNVPPSVSLPLFVQSESLELDGRIQRNLAAFSRLARVSTIHTVGFRGVEVSLRGVGTDDYEMFLLAQQGSIQLAVDGVSYFIHLKGAVDIGAERVRLTRAAEVAEKERDSLAARLANPSFIERAKPEAVEKARADHAEKASTADKYRAALARLG
jgi:valyl-tRNA synthetase